eukprot:CAMPEP_0174288542 /NCGR_PEP_ID=MMETSP0809-20121228/21208_1 /TAXON_ID=73025 ORGANISM="Eutreptiella gymnastica-like, Strain CCMP1594" /NCGR_SAMPLE_ID=MMETSP0809 /ASSEMBLY_ACC=CAM_ASM_000658 /LENGTH=72 /DNA_ID=CAMNT_0015385833 /DNA_START=377 /DNA_END=593 /DNA_ORIENTATION=+
MTESTAMERGKNDGAQLADTSSSMARPRVFCMAHAANAKCQVHGFLFACTHDFWCAKVLKISNKRRRGTGGL